MSFSVKQLGEITQMNPKYRLLRNHKKTLDTDLTVPTYMDDF